MTDDHYVTLGVEPTADAAIIRAAYRSQMRLYHPDRNDSPAAVDRARAVIAAFAVLGDAEKRLHYDWGRRRAGEPAPKPVRWYEKGRRYPLAAAFAVLALLLFLASAAIVRMTPDERKPIAEPESVATKATADADDGVRLAAREEVVPPPPPPQARPAIEPYLEPVPLVPDRVEPVKVTTVPAAAPRFAPPPRLALQARTKVEPTPARPRENARCRAAKPGAEATICNDDNLAALDQNVVLFFNQSLAFGAPAKRPVLLDSRARFLTRREQCRSDLCLQHLHLAHLRELTAIVANAPSLQGR